MHRRQFLQSSTAALVAGLAVQRSQAESRSRCRPSTTGSRSRPKRRRSPCNSAAPRPRSAAAGRPSSRPSCASLLGPFAPPNKWQTTVERRAESGRPLPRRTRADGGGPSAAADLPADAAQEVRPAARRHRRPARPRRPRLQHRRRPGRFAWRGRCDQVVQLRLRPATGAARLRRRRALPHSLRPPSRQNGAIRQAGCVRRSPISACNCWASC